MPETGETTKTIKERALEAISQLPDDVDWEDIMYDLYFRERVELGLQEIAEGKTVPHEVVMRDVAEWLRSAGQ